MRLRLIPGSIFRPRAIESLGTRLPFLALRAVWGCTVVGGRHRGCVGAAQRYSVSIREGATSVESVIAFAKVVLYCDASSLTLFSFGGVGHFLLPAHVPPAVRGAEPPAPHQSFSSKGTQSAHVEGSISQRPLGCSTTKAIPGGRKR